MEVAIWDTYVNKKDGSIMHFDIIVPADIKDSTVIYDFGRQYLKTKDQEGQALSAKECQFCHTETLKPHWEASIREKGYFIFEIENCI